MTKYIVIDTEGTGLFRARNTLPDGRKVVARSHEPGQPRMAEYAHVLLDEDFELEDTYQQYVLPVGWRHGVLTPDGWRDGEPMLEMPPEAYEKNKLSMDFLRANGLPISQALFRYADAIDEGRVVVGFNQQHDGRQVRGELRRNSYPDRFDDSPAICAMRSIGANYKGRIKKLNGLGGFPRLIDAAAHFGIGYAEGLRHTALEDAMVTARVAKELHRLGALLPAAVHKAKGLFEGETA
jgi:DNA polymerase-3 subunit epsilon